MARNNEAYNPCIGCGGEDCVCCSYYLEQQASNRYQDEEPGIYEDNFDAYDAFLMQEEERRERMIEEEEEMGLFFKTEEERDRFYAMKAWEKTHLC